TRFSRDWSSDVCSSDLRSGPSIDGFPWEPRTPPDLATCMTSSPATPTALLLQRLPGIALLVALTLLAIWRVSVGTRLDSFTLDRSEERRVGNRVASMSW